MTAYDQIAIRKPRGQTQKSPVIQSLGIMYSYTRCADVPETYPPDPVPRIYRALPHTFQLYVTAPKPLVLKELGIFTSSCTSIESS